MIDLYLKHGKSSSVVGIENSSVEPTLKLLKEGATVPFIARYRKEMTGNLDEVAIFEIEKSFKTFQEIVKRKEYILKTIADKGQLSPELESKIGAAWHLKDLEDLYLPYKKAKSSLAEKARKMGLERLAKIICSGSENAQSAANRFISSDLPSIEEVLKHTTYIVSEWINENAAVRNQLRKELNHSLKIKSSLKKGVDEREAQVYRHYFEHEELLKRAAAHRLLAITRGVEEGKLAMDYKFDKSVLLDRIVRIFFKSELRSTEFAANCAKDAWTRLLKSSLIKECYNEAKEKADVTSIKVFAQNLEQLLLTAPIGGKRILAIDPGFRTGCKLVVLNETGDLQHNETIYPHPPQNQAGKAKAKIAHLVNVYKIEAIAVGNGTAGKETEQLVKATKFDRDVNLYVVNEAGASVYSASKIARAEFPDYDVTVRGAVSIGRRLVDPLAELVKIEPKSIGVGQYQHDVDQKLLQLELDHVVEKCVNRVGVWVNTASPYLLQYVAGVGPKLSENIAAYRKENGGFKSRKELLKVPGMGPKAFEQAAGFLRINEGVEVLDGTAVHPERYTLVKKIAKSKKCSVADLIGNKTLVDAIDWLSYKDEKTSAYTLEDIASELLKPARDPRKDNKILEFDKRLKTLRDVEPGMVVPGQVTNLTNFGAFVDIGIKENGLLHLSQIVDRFISSPTEVLNLNQKVTVKVIDVDIERKRFSLTMKGI